MSWRASRLASAWPSTRARSPPGPLRTRQRDPPDRDPGTPLHRIGRWARCARPARRTATETIPRQSAPAPSRLLVVALALAPRSSRSRSSASSLAATRYPRRGLELGQLRRAAGAKALGHTDSASLMFEIEAHPGHCARDIVGHEPVDPGRLPTGAVEQRPSHRLEDGALAVFIGSGDERGVRVEFEDMRAAFVSAPVRELYAEQLHESTPWQIRSNRSRASCRTAAPFWFTSSSPRSSARTSARPASAMWIGPRSAGAQRSRASTTRRSAYLARASSSRAR